MPFITLTLLAIVTTKTSAHSWVRCTDYAAEITGGDYDEDQCKGWIRDWSFDNTEFGVDRGINFQTEIGSGGALCGGNSLDGTPETDYASDYANSNKLAQYIAGSTVRVVWPAKNHANYECFGNIPDNSMKLFMNTNTNPTADIANIQGAANMEAKGYRLIKDWQEGCTPGSDGCGFQNCPKFCENTDRATCFGDFVVPSDVSSGYYTFVWYWIFNPGSPYISCWEAYIDASGSGAPTTPNEPSTGGTDGTDGSVINGYLTQMPVCVIGQSYTYDTVLGFVALQFQDVATREEISIVGVSEEANGYNFTAQFSHENGQVKAITATADEFCDDFITFYGDGTTCEICSDIVTFAVYDESGCVISSNKIYFVIVVLLFVMSVF
eukprot:541653_1